jgi:ribonucleotide monophosphatase NagD (HAD superfamily)
MKTIFCDIDGTILEHMGSLSKINYDQQILKGVVEKFDEWNSKSYKVIITTARPESMRSFTENQLKEFGLGYSELIMDLPTGTRYLFNDTKPDGTVTAIAYSLERNVGIAHIEI